jgi:hypothetical protein
MHLSERIFPMRCFPTLLLVAALAPTAIAYGEVASQSKEMVVLQSADLPQPARAEGQAMTLRSPGDGRTYLYIEQQQLGRLLILDVSDPARIKQAGTVNLAAAAAFDFAGSAGGYGELVRLRNGNGLAVIDFKNPRQPVLAALGGQFAASAAEPVGRDGLLLSRVSAEAATAHEAAPLPRDYQVVDAAKPHSPQLLATVKMVNQELVNDETGTTYLLGADGLTVVRRPAVELRYWLESTYTN